MTRLDKCTTCLITFAIVAGIPIGISILTFLW